MRRLSSLLAIASIALAALSVQPAYCSPLAIDGQRSQMTVYVRKQGLFSFLADDHQIDAPIASGWYDGATKTVQLTVDAAKMKVLDPKLPASRRAKVQATMNGPQVLDVARYPTIAFRSTSIDESTTADRWTLTGDLTLHGETHPITFRVRKVDADHFSGSATIRQTEFGITPIRLAGGTVSVKDDVTVAFAITLAH